MLMQCSEHLSNVGVIIMNDHADGENLVGV